MWRRWWRLLSIDFEFRVNGVMREIPCQSTGKGSANNIVDKTDNDIKFSEFIALRLNSATNSDNFAS